MFNRNIKVILEPGERVENGVYTWYEVGNENIGWERNLKGCFRTILIDIYKDKILIENINIHPDLMEQFKAYEASHRSEIERLKLEEPSNFTQTGWHINWTKVYFDD